MLVVNVVGAKVGQENLAVPKKGGFNGSPLFNGNAGKDAQAKAVLFSVLNWRGSQPQSALVGTTRAVRYALRWHGTRAALASFLLVVACSLGESCCCRLEQQQNTGRQDGCSCRSGRHCVCVCAWCPLSNRKAAGSSRVMGGGSFKEEEQAQKLQRQEG